MMQSFTYLYTLARGFATVVFLYAPHIFLTYVKLNEIVLLMLNKDFRFFLHLDFLEKVGHEIRISEINN